MAAEATSTLAGAGALAQPHRAALTGPTGEPASNCGTRSGRAALGACFNPEQYPAFHDEGAGSDSAIQAALAGVCVLVLQLGKQDHLRAPFSRAHNYGGPSFHVGPHARHGCVGRSWRTAGDWFCGCTWHGFGFRWFSVPA
jgi:hypothetical protein